MDGPLPPVGGEPPLQSGFSFAVAHDVARQSPLRTVFVYSANSFALGANAAMTARRIDSASGSWKTSSA